MRHYQHVIERFTLITGSKGVFVFTVDDEVLFSKKALGRHAEPDELLSLFNLLKLPNLRIASLYSLRG